MGKFIELTASDGHKLAAYLAEPPGKARGGLVVIPEIFGVNSHIKAVADGYAADGYRAVSPAMFDRARRNYDTGYSQPEIEAGVAIMQKLDWKQSMLDVEAAVAEAKKAGKVGIVGYCYGGTVSWVAAARVSGLACAALSTIPGAGWAMRRSSSRTKCWSASRCSRTATRGPRCKL